MYEYATLCLSFHHLMNTWVVSIWGLLQRMVLEHSFIHFVTELHFQFSGVCARSWVAVSYNFVYYFEKAFYILTRISHPHQPSFKSHRTVCDVYLTLFWFVFSWQLIMWNIFSCADWPCVYLLQRNICLDSLPIFSLTICLFIIEL
jgi:hypothetical protein